MTVVAAPTVLDDPSVIEGVNPDAAAPCRAQICTDPPRTGVWLVHMRCPGCGGTTRSIACDPCWQGNQAEAAVRHYPPGCGHTDSPAAFILSVERIGGAS